MTSGPRSNRPRWASFLLVPSIAFAGATLAYFRIPGVASRTVWAEDGTLFLQEYIEQGPGLFNPYAGYLHFLPRAVVAFVTPVFGIESYASAITISCCVIIGLVAALTFYCSSLVTMNPVLRLCWASIPVLSAPGAIETLGNVANLHWYLLWLAPWVLLKTPSTLSQGILLGSTALIIGLTEIQSALFLPLVFLRAENRGLWWAKTGLATGIAAQLFTLWMFPRPEGGTGEQGDLLSVVYGYLLNTSAAIFYGDSPTIIDLIQRFGYAPIILTAIPFALITYLLLRLGDPLQRFMGCMWLIASAVIWAAAVVVNPAPYFHYSQFTSTTDWADFLLSRYSAVPSMFLIALLPLLASSTPERETIPTRLAAQVGTPQFRGGIVGAFIILQTVYFFPVTDLRSFGPEWAPQVRVAEEACRIDPSLQSVDIKQAPGSWVTEIPCTELRP